MHRLLLKSLTASLVIGLFFTAGCSKKTEKKEPVLATIGDRTISVMEFRRRAELTARPNYASVTDDEDKIIALNNLVYEKIFASEAQKRGILAHNEHFKNYIQGIKEQQMRKQLYEHMAAQSVHIDSSEVNTRFQLSKREYHLAYYSLNDQTAAQFAQRVQQDPAQRDTAFNEMQAKVGKTFEKDVNWKDPEADPVHEALFSKPLVKNQIIGPIRTDDGYSLIMKVLDWKEYPMIGPEENAVHRQEVVEKLQDLKAKRLWNEYKYNLMKDKVIEFDPTALKRIVDLFTEEFSAVGKIKQNPNPDSRDISEISQDFSETMDSMSDLPFFKVDGKTWTIGNFKKALSVHPLVYRKGRFNKREFPQQFKHAVVDLVADSYLTKEAAKRSIDKDPVVSREVNLWKDANLALYFYQDYLKARASFDSTVTDTTQAMNAVADALIDSLGQRYSGRIQINMKEFDQIKLNRAPLVAYEMNVPYPMAVPSFPNITRSSKMDYQAKAGK